MSATMKVLAQAYPSAATQTTLYTVGAGKSAVVSTVSVCNQTTAALTFNIAVIPSGGTLGSASYIAYGTTIPANNTEFITIGMTLEAGASISVYNTNVGISYNAFGSELS